MIICKIDAAQLGLLDNQIVTHIDWQISSDKTFNTVEHEELNDDAVDENGNKILQYNWNRLNLDPAKTWYGRARVLIKNTVNNEHVGWSTYGNLDIFNVIDNTSTEATVGELPSRVAIPVISTNSDINNHRPTMFTIYARGYEVIGNSVHDATTWIIEDINSNVIWSKLRDKNNKESLIVNNFILKSNTAYRLKAIFHSSANSSSQVGCCSIKTSNGNGIRLLQWLETYDIKEDLKINIAIPSNLNYTSITYRILGNIDNVIEEITSINTTDTSVSFNKDNFKFNNSYVLEIIPMMNKKEIGVTHISFRTITPNIQDLYNGDVKYDNYREWLYQNGMSEPSDEKLEDKSSDLIIDLKDPTGNSDTDNYYQDAIGSDVECSGYLSDDYLVLQRSGRSSITVITNDTVNRTNEAGGASGNRDSNQNTIWHSAQSNSNYLARYEVKLTNPKKKSKYLYYYVYNNYQGSINANNNYVAPDVEFTLPESLDIIGTDAVELRPVVEGSNAPTAYKVFTLPYIHTNPVQTNPFGYPYAVVSSYANYLNNTGNQLDYITIYPKSTGSFKLYVIGEKTGYNSVIKTININIKQERERVLFVVLNFVGFQDVYDYIDKAINRSGSIIGTGSVIEIKTWVFRSYSLYSVSCPSDVLNAYDKVYVKIPGGHAHHNDLGAPRGQPTLYYEFTAPNSVKGVSNDLITAMEQYFTSNTGILVEYDKK